MSGPEGCELVLASGDLRLIEGMSHRWAAIHGYNNPAIERGDEAQIDAPCMSCSAA